MGISAAGALFLIAAGATNVSEYLDHDRYVEAAEPAGLADKVLTVVAGAATAAAVYRMSDDAFEYFPLEGRVSGNGFDFRESLSMRRGGFRFQLSAIRQGGGPSVSAAPNFRDDSKKMAHIMPGYPQPARVVIGVKINY